MRELQSPARFEDNEEEQSQAGMSWRSRFDPRSTACRGGRARSSVMHVLAMPDAIEYRGVPRTSDEWAALTKLANGQNDLTRDELRCLFMLALAERQLSRACLSH